MAEFMDMRIIRLHNIITFVHSMDIVIVIDTNKFWSSNKNPVYSMVNKLSLEYSDLKEALSKPQIERIFCPSTFSSKNKLEDFLFDSINYWIGCQE